MNPIKVGGHVSVDALLCEHVRAVINSTPSLEEAAKVLGKSARWLLRFRERHRLGRPLRQSNELSDDGETWLDD